MIKPEQFELFIGKTSTFLEMGYGKKVESIGGSYTKVDSYGRRVIVPNNEAGIELANEIISQFSGSDEALVCMKGESLKNIPHWVCLCDSPKGRLSTIDDFLNEYELSYQNAHNLGLVP